MLVEKINSLIGGGHCGDPVGRGITLLDIEKHKILNLRVGDITMLGGGGDSTLLKQL